MSTPRLSVSSGMPRLFAVVLLQTVPVLIFSASSFIVPLRPPVLPERLAGLFPFSPLIVHLAEKRHLTHPPIPMSCMCLGFSFRCVLSYTGLSSSESRGEYGTAISSSSTPLATGVLSWPCFSVRLYCPEVPGLENPVDLVVAIVVALLEGFGMRVMGVGRRTKDQGKIGEMPHLVHLCGPVP